MTVGVSVIIPVYNREQYLAECLQSVMNQERTFPLEIIVSDDGSTDRSLEIARSFGEPVTVLEKPESCKTQGCGSTRNRGIEKAQYPFICFLDSDDIYLPGHLLRLYDYLQLHPEIQMVIDEQYGSVADNVAEKWKWYYKDTGEVRLKSVFIDTYFGTNSYMCRRSLFEKVGGAFDEEIILAEDYDFYLRVLEKFRILILEGGGSVVRHHGGRSSTASIRRTYTSAALALKKALKRYPYPFAWVCKRKAIIQFRFAQADLMEKKYCSALCRLLYAGILDPIRAVKTMFGR